MTERIHEVNKATKGQFYSKSCSVPAPPSTPFSNKEKTRA